MVEDKMTANRLTFCKDLRKNLGPYVRLVFWEAFVK